MRYRISIFSMMLFLCLNVLCSIQYAFAQNDLAFGEMRIYGDVFIRSSTGNWMPAPSSYPILNDTVISTEKGSVSLFYKNGSRIDLSESTTASLSRAKTGNTVHLAKGKLEANTSPKSSFIFSSDSTALLIKRNSAKKEESTDERFLGIMSAEDKGIEVQSISGTASLKVNGSKAKDIPSGGSIFVGPGNEISTYQTAKKISKTKKCDKYKKPKKHKSPYTFGDDSDPCYDD